MNNEEKIEYVKEYILDEALDSIAKHGRYWNASISSALASTLEALIIESGHDIHMREIAPHWEHVYYFYSDVELLERIAIERAEIRDGINTHSNMPI